MASNKRNSPADASWRINPPSKAARVSNLSRTPVPAHGRPFYLAKAIHQPHPDSKLCQDFHWLPYPLGLLPYDSWHKLHHPAKVHPPLPFRCPTFLVAERLAWDEKLVPISAKEQNEELNWAVNFELGILDPFMEDPEQELGGKNSQTNKFYPYQNEFEMKQALRLIFTSENISDASWSLWASMQMDLQEMFRLGGTKRLGIGSASSKLGTRQKTSEAEEIDLTMSPDRASKPRTSDGPSGRPTPPSSSSEHSTGKAPAIVPGNQVSFAQPHAPGTAFVDKPADLQPSFEKDQSITSYKTLQDFYSLLDRIERTSFVGALFLEAYAERLQRDMCRDCWLKRYIDLRDPACS
ncbi:hypothetical protein K458DRAFT_439186 [Lentithecium fluviatile CBS 122367]|uniref:Uncharacterized protein n=1 Tax=Lentithecium fluviatile CBS 122367 TaxID=1168545 RepID=A0A6G1JHS1_9PLEO|nr:hypothetical protein K458DRAFT_439186 [Lentithecium fluviatile CBS 122367]